jgi:hypothetical protein
MDESCEVEHTGHELPEARRMQDLLDRMREKYDFYANVGFFRDLPFDTLRTQFMKLHGGETEFCWLWLDFLMLKFNESQIWTGDPECNVDSANSVYERVIAEWSAVSDGIFAPSNIRENWRHWNGPIEVTFELNGQQRMVRPKYQQDYLDMLILKQINQYLNPEKLFYCFADSNFALVFMLDHDQHKAFLNMGFPFHW